MSGCSVVTTTSTNNQLFRPLKQRSNLTRNYAYKNLILRAILYFIFKNLENTTFVDIHDLFTLFGMKN